MAAASAHAESKKDKADALFKQGKKLMAEKHYADACDAFAKSFKADPAVGAQLNLGKCYEEWGKIGRAFTTYQAAEKLARDTKDDRAGQIHALVENLDTQVPRLTIKLPADAPKSLKVTFDARPVTQLGVPFVVDPGPHTIEYGVGKEKKQRIVPLDRGAESEVTLEVTKAMIDAGAVAGDDRTSTTPAQTTPVQAEREPARPGRNMRIGAIALGGAGVLAIGVSSVMTLSARSKYKDALDKYCMGETDMCDSMGLDITHDARSTANTATIIFVAGLAAVGGGVVLYLLAPDGKASSEEQARYLVPSVTSDGGGLVYGGRY
jgi:serine/threonine-protein kinase